MEQNVNVTFLSKELDQHECYIAQLLVGHLSVLNRTLFPSEWPPQKVMDKILEAMDYALFG